MDDDDGGRFRDGCRPRNRLSTGCVTRPGVLLMLPFEDALDVRAASAAFWRTIVAHGTGRRESAMMERSPPGSLDADYHIVMAFSQPHWSVD